jgi:hypothetical protein
MAIMNSRFIEKHYLMNEEEGKSQIMRAVFVEEKGRMMGGVENAKVIDNS